MARAWQALDLTDEQAESLKTLRLEHYKALRPLQQEMAELRLKKQHLLSADEVDLKAVNKVIDDQTALSNSIQKKNAAHRTEARSMLSDEQRMLLDQRRKMGRKAYTQGRGGRGAPGI
jgi:Spy/CpxP family protein refolding chaperone